MLVKDVLKVYCSKAKKEGKQDFYPTPRRRETAVRGRPLST